MIDVKVDLLNKIKMDKYYEEKDLIRIAKNNQISHRKKIEKLDEIFKNIALLNNKLILVEQYFIEENKQDSSNNKTINK